MRSIKMIIGLALTLALAVGASGCSSNSQKGEGKFTKEEYEKITDGIGYKKVVSIVGGEGKILTQNGQKDKDETVLFSWDKEEGGRVYLTFHNNKLVSKSQY